MAAAGHQDAFPRTRPNGWCRFGQETSAGVRGNARDAPKASEYAGPTSGSNRRGYWPDLIDYLCSASEDRGWNRQAKRLGGLLVDDEIEDGRLLNRQISGLGTFEDSPRVTAGLAKGRRDPRPIADQAAGHRELAPHIARWNGMA